MSRNKFKLRYIASHRFSRISSEVYLLYHDTSAAGKPNSHGTLNLWSIHKQDRHRNEKVMHRLNVGLLNKDSYTVVRSCFQCGPIIPVQGKLAKIVTNSFVRFWLGQHWISKGAFLWSSVSKKELWDRTERLASASGKSSREDCRKKMAAKLRRAWMT